MNSSDELSQLSQKWCRAKNYQRLDQELVEKNLPLCAWFTLLTQCLSSRWQVIDIKIKKTKSNDVKAKNNQKWSIVVRPLVGWKEPSSFLVHSFNLISLFQIPR